MNDDLPARRIAWRPDEELLERAKRGVIDDAAAADELLNLIDPDRADALGQVASAGSTTPAGPATGRNGSSTGTDTAEDHAAAEPAARPR
jgi:hypothetical protein